MADEVKKVTDQAVTTGKSIWSSIGERLNNPLIFAFCISWIFINFDYFYIILTSTTYTDFTIIYNDLYTTFTNNPHNYGWFVWLRHWSTANFLIYPMLGAYFYALVVLKISASFAKIHSKAKVNIDEKTDEGSNTPNKYQIAHELALKTIEENRINTTNALKAQIAKTTETEEDLSNKINELIVFNTLAESLNTILSISITKPAGANFHELLKHIIFKKGKTGDVMANEISNNKKAYQFCLDNHYIKIDPDNNIVTVTESGSLIENLLDIYALHLSKHDRFTTPPTLLADLHTPPHNTDQLPATE